MDYFHTALLTASPDAGSVTGLRIWQPTKKQDFEFSFYFWTTFEISGIALFSQ